MDNSLTIVWIAGMLFTAAVVLFVAIRYGIVRDEKKSGERRVALNLDALRSSFRDAVAKVESHIAEHGKRYDIPWVVMLHDGDALSRPALEQCGLSTVLAGSLEAPAADAARWHFFDRGIVVEIASEQLEDPHGNDLEDRRWEEFAALCGRYRPQRPLDSIIVSIPAALLADRSPEGRERLRQKAESTSRRIWIVQNRYAMRFAVYVVISGAEGLPGFQSFASALPSALRDSMLGWSSPFQPAAIYQAGWVSQAFDQIEQNVSDASAELFASQAQLSSSTELFLLPSRLSALRAGAQDYLNALMRPNAFHEPFFMRGIYVVGTDQEPVFLRDLIDTKVFAEFGLARAAHSQKLARPLMTRVGRTLAVGIPTVFAVGIIATTIQLNRVLPTLAAGLEGLKRDTEYRAQASNAGERIDFEWRRKTALQLMIGLEDLRSRSLSKSTFSVSKSFNNPFMPGSWPIFDDVRSRALQRIQDEFAELGIRTLQQAIYRRTAEITNAPLNPITDELTGGKGDCDIPGAQDADIPRDQRPSVAIEALPEFITLARYANRSTQLAGSVSAMQGLKSPHPNSSKELRMLVLDMLGADLPGDLSTSVDLFRDASAKEASIVNTQAVRTAVRCSFRKAVIALNQHLFDSNDLIDSEEKIITARNGVVNLFATEAVPSSTDVIEAYRKLQLALTEQKALLNNGEGNWMMQDEMKLGTSYDKLMQTFVNNPLIGPEVVAETQRESQTSYARTRQRFLTLFSDEASISKDGKLSFSKSREALLIATEHLLDQPFMLPAAGNSLQATSSPTVLNWDVDELIRAVKLAEGRKKYLGDSLPKFPMAMQEPVSDVVDYQFALRLVDLIGHAYSLADSEANGSEVPLNSAASFETVTGHVKRLISILKELEQHVEARILQTLLANDATARLRLLNNQLQESRPYSLSDDNDEPRAETRGSVNLFGSASQDLPDYLTQQAAKMQSISAQVQSLRPALQSDARNNNELVRWSAIARELDLYVAKDPKGSLGKLERFMLELGRDLDAPTCLAVLRANEPAKRASNYFVEKHAELHRNLSRRCLSLDRRNFIEQWTSFSADFNRLLKGRRPFIGSRSPARPNDYALMTPADMAEVGNLLNRLPAVSPEIFARNNVPEGSVAPIRDFAAHLAQVRQALYPLFPIDPSQPAALDIGVRFRANVNDEIDGNKIIDWSINVGDQSLKLRDTPRLLRWKSGDAIRITLRFANDVPMLPRADASNPYLEVSRKTAVFRFEGPLALIDMMQLMRQVDGSDARFSLLKLDVPVQVDPKDNTVRPKPVRVFLGISLSEPGKTAPLPWPAFFPERAPVVEKP